MLTNDDLQKIGELLKGETGPINTNLEELRNEFKKQRKDIKYLRKTLDLAIDHFDNRDVKVRKEIDKIKEHIGLTVE